MLPIPGLQGDARAGLRSWVPLPLEVAHQDQVDFLRCHKRGREVLIGPRAKDRLAPYHRVVPPYSWFSDLDLRVA